MFLRRILFSAVLLCAAFSNAPQAEAREMEDMSVVVVRSIDKLSARTHTFDIPVDKTVQFGKSLFIKVRACRKSPPVGEPEAAAFLQIWERKPHEDQSKWVFSGWMYSSNPALSAMDHPVYDVWVIDCKKSATSAKSEKFSSEVAPDEAAADAAAVAGEAEGVNENAEGVDTEASPDDTEAAPAGE